MGMNGSCDSQIVWMHIHDDDCVVEQDDLAARLASKLNCDKRKEKISSQRVYKHDDSQEMCVICVHVQGCDELVIHGETRKEEDQK